MDRIIHECPFCARHLGVGKVSMLLTPYAMSREHDLVTASGLNSPVNYPRRCDRQGPHLHFSSHTFTTRSNECGIAGKRVSSVHCPQSALKHASCGKVVDQSLAGRVFDVSESFAASISTQLTRITSGQSRDRRPTPNSLGVSEMARKPESQAKRLGAKCMRNAP